MAKRTRYIYQAANEFGTALSKSADYSLTENDILKEGNQFIKLSSNAVLTLPVASLNLKGIAIRVFSSSGTAKITVATGFGNGGASYDVVTPPAYCTVDFWCDGSYWYAKSENVAAS